MFLLLCEPSGFLHLLQEPDQQDKRYFGVSAKASYGYDDSSTYLVQSASLTSCEANGCGVTCEGGGRAGKPCVKNFPEAIRNVGSKDGYSCCGARRENGIEGSVEMA